MANPPNLRRTPAPIPATPTLKGVLARRARRARSVFLHPSEFYELQQIELLENQRVVRIDVLAKCAYLENGEAVAYDKALVATGAMPRRLTVPGADLPGVARVHRGQGVDVRVGVHVALSRTGRAFARRKGRWR